MLHALILYLRRRTYFLVSAAVHAEDPPFGGLWCDQPALFFH